MKKDFKQLVAEANAEVKTLSVDEAKALVGNPDYIFVDIREPNEPAESGSIPGSEHAVRGMLEFHASEGPYHKPFFASGKNLVLYCASAGRSALAAKTLKDMGFDNVSHLAGGFKAWTAANGPVEKK
jgi:rhodanese-related sulfurtransferase